MNLKLSSVPYISAFLQSSITIPKQWINDIKLVEFEEILSSSVGALALLFRWNKIEKSEFTEIASGLQLSTLPLPLPRQVGYDFGTIWETTSLK